MVQGVLQSAGHFAADKIGKKAEEVAERRSKNRGEALAQPERIRDQHMLHSFLQVEYISFQGYVYWPARKIPPHPFQKFLPFLRTIIKLSFKFFLVFHFLKKSPPPPQEGNGQNIFPCFILYESSLSIEAY